MAPIIDEIVFSRNTANMLKCIGDIEITARYRWIASLARPVLHALGSRGWIMCGESGLSRLIWLMDVRHAMPEELQRLRGLRSMIGLIEVRVRRHIGGREACAVFGILGMRAVRGRIFANSVPIHAIVEESPGIRKGPRA